MANTRIKDISTTATSAASDDYLVIDGATNGTRKIAASAVGGDTWYDFTTSITPSIASGSSALYLITPTNVSDMTAENIVRTKALIVSSSSNYILHSYYYTNSSSAFTLSVTNIGTSTASGTLHIVAPFKISSVSTTM